MRVTLVPVLTHACPGALLLGIRRYPGETPGGDGETAITRASKKAEAKVSRHVRLHACSLLALAGAGAFVL